MEESLMDLDNKIKDMNKNKASLKREIDQNQLEAMNLRESIKALSDKKAQIIAETKTVESTLMSRRDEISTIDQLIDKERKILDAEKRDLILLRETIHGEQVVFHAEKVAGLEAIEETRKKLARMEVTMLNNEGDLKNRQKEIEGQLKELSDRRIKVNEEESKLSVKQTECEQIKKQVDTNLAETKKALEEAQAKEVAYDSLSKSIREKEESLREQDSRIKTCYEDIDLSKKNLTERERDIIIEEDRLKQIRLSLIKEVEMTRIDEKKKKEMLKELT